MFALAFALLFSFYFKLLGGWGYHKLCEMNVLCSKDISNGANGDSWDRYDEVDPPIIAEDLSVYVNDRHNTRICSAKKIESQFYNCAYVSGNSGRCGSCWKESRVNDGEYVSRNIRT